MSTHAKVYIAHKAFTPASGADEKLSPIIFLHGLTGSKEFWDDVPQVIADKSKRKAYAIDARNHGDSEYTDSFTFDMNADDVFHFMDKMNISKAVLIGHSMGGLTATNAALKNPERIDMIISEDMFTKKLPQQILNQISNFMKTWVEIVRSLPSTVKETEVMKAAADIMIEKVPKEFEAFLKKDDVYKMKFGFKRNPDGSYDVKFNSDTILRALKDAETLMPDPRGQYDKPAYFLYGEHSPFNVGSEEENIRKLFPKAELTQFKGATHNVHGEFPDKFVEVVLKCLHQ